MDPWTIVLGWVIFGGMHIGMGADPIRSTLIEKLGLGPFRGLFSLIALVTLGFLIFAYAKGYPAGGIFLGWGMDSPVMVRVSEFLGIVAFVLLFTGVFNRTPMGFLPGNPVPYGITRITRHPMNMAFAVFAIGHLLTNRYAGDWILFGGLILYGYLGSLHQDRKVARRSEGALQQFFAGTSIIPFAAIISGRQNFKLGEISKIGTLLGIALALLARMAHP